MQLTIDDLGFEEAEEFYYQARYNMVNNQVIPSGVTNDSIVKSMLSMPREKFVHDRWQEVSYIDDHVPINDERKLLMPELFAKMLQFSEISSKSKVLDIACGAGYSTAIISKIAKHVTGIDNDAELIKLAKKNLSELEIKNAEFKKSNIFKISGLKDSYDSVLINGIVENIQSSNLFNALKNGGQMILIELCDHSPKVVKYTKIHDKIARDELFYAHAPILK